MSDDLGFPHDHAEIAWSHWLAQHVGKLTTDGFVRSFYPPLNALDKALNDLFTLRWLETAEGVQLDGIGSIVGITRRQDHAVFLDFFGFSAQISGRGFGQARLRRRNEPWATSLVLGDTEFRTLIKMKIALNNARGTAEEVMAAFNFALNTNRTFVLDVGNATAHIYINAFLMSFDPRSQLLEYMVPRAAGVKFWLYYWDADYTFGFINQNMGYKGFGVGILARRPASNIPPIVVSMSIWDRGDSIWDGGHSVWDLKGAN